MEKRIVFTKIWRDSWFSDLSRSSRLLFIYLITNPYIGFSGYFECPDRLICFETGLTQPELDQAKIDLQGKVAFHEGWVYVKNAEKLDPIKGENNPLRKAYEKEITLVNESYQTILHEKIAINQEQKDPTEGLPRGYEAPQERKGNGNGNGNKGGVGEKYGSIASITPQAVSDLAKTLGVSTADVEKQRVYLVNYCESTGKTYKNYLAALRNWVQRKIDDGKIKRTRIVGGSTASDLLAQKERQYAVNS